MALGRMEIGLVAVLIAMLAVGAAAQSSCTTTIISLAPCLNYITGNSSTPSSSCCSQLASVVNTSPQCLCAVLNGGGSNLGLNINQTQALALPGACNVQTPPLSRCNAASPADSPVAADTPAAADSPAAADTPAAADSPGGTTSEPSVPSGTGSKTVPSTGGNSSEASSTNLHFSLLFFLLFIASYGSTFISI